MSPEQARGQAVDKRTDIWAFGACCSRCSRGRRRFAGATVSGYVGGDHLSERPGLGEAASATLPLNIRTAAAPASRKGAATAPAATLAMSRLEIDDALNVRPDEARHPGAPGVLGLVLVWRRPTCRRINGSLAWRRHRRRHRVELRPAASSPAITRFPILLAAGQQFTEQVGM